MKQFFTLLGIVAMGATAYGQADTDIVNIPDENFKRALLRHNIDTNGDTEISYGEARAYTEGIYVSGIQKISNLTGIEAFVNITSLYCNDNQLTSLDVSKNTALKELRISATKITNIDVSKNTALQSLDIINNEITNIDISKNTELVDFRCGGNPIEYVDVSHNKKIQYLSYGENTSVSNLMDLPKLKGLELHNIPLANIDYRVLQKIEGLSLSGEKYTSVYIAHLSNLKSFSISGTKITNIDVSKNTALQYLYCSDNQLTQLNLANGNNNNLRLSTRNNSNLMCIQIDRGFSPNGEWSKDSHALYSDNCNYPTLSITEIKAENAIQIFNPVKDNLVIKTTAKIESIEIYNTAGQLVKVLFRGNTQVQDLAKGIYLLKITTDKGVITQKIIKQ